MSSRTSKSVNGIDLGMWIISFASVALFAMLILAPYALGECRSPFIDCNGLCTLPEECGGRGGGGAIGNPIEAQSFGQLVIGIADAVSKIAIVLAGVALIFAGFKFLTAGASGDTKSLQDAKKIFFWVLIGTAITVGATKLAEVVVNTVQGL